MSKPNRRRTNVPAWRGRYFGLEEELYEKVTEVATSLGVSKAHVINLAIRYGMERAIDQIKYG